jgi:DNA-binding PadR family transcriptional regulator
MFERGYLKYALLDLLQERPKHGYEMMKDLEERMGGFYAPSAGAIYPTLQMLEDRGWATAETLEGKKVYTITDEGRHALVEVAERRGPRPGSGPEFDPGFGPGFGPGIDPRGRGRRHEHEHEHEHEHHGAHHHERPDGPPPPRGGPWGWGGRGRGGPGFGPGFDWRAQPEAHELARQARELGRMFLIAGRESINQPERIAQLRAIVERTRAELEAFVDDARSASQSGSVADGPADGSSTQQGAGGPVEQL